MLDSIYNIQAKSTLHVVVANYTHKHAMLNKGQCIGHIETSIDHIPQTAINSLTTQMMLDEPIQPDSFTPPSHTLPDDVSKSVNQQLQLFKSQSAQDETSIGIIHLTKMQTDTGYSEAVSHRPYSITIDTSFFYITIKALLKGQVLYV